MDYTQRDFASPHALLRRHISRPFLFLGYSPSLCYTSCPSLSLSISYVYFSFRSYLPIFRASLKGLPPSFPFFNPPPCIPGKVPPCDTPNRTSPFPWRSHALPHHLVDLSVPPSSLPQSLPATPISCNPRQLSPPSIQPPEASLAEVS